MILLHAIKFFKKETFFFQTIQTIFIRKVTNIVTVLLSIRVFNFSPRTFFAFYYNKEKMFLQSPETISIRNWNNQWTTPKPKSRYIPPIANRGIFRTQQFNSIPPTPPIIPLIYYHHQIFHYHESIFSARRLELFLPLPIFFRRPTGVEYFSREFRTSETEKNLILRRFILELHRLFFFE